MKHNRAIFACVFVLLVWVSVAGAQANLGLNGVGVRVGMANAENLDAALAFGVFTDLGLFHPSVSFETYLTYWSQSEGVAGFSEVSFRDVALGAKAEYMFALASPTVKPFVGGGLSLHFLHTEVAMETLTFGALTIPGVTTGASDTKLGLDLGGGVRAGVSDKVDVIGEVWYTMVSDFNQLGFQAGLLFRL
jgi:opacity protein-like surface antigen